MSDWDPQNIWEGLHKDIPFIRPAEVVSARLHSTAHPDDGRMPPPDPSIVPATHVLYDDQRQHWYVKFRNPRGSLKRFHVKTGFYTQAEAIAYRDTVKPSA